MTHLLKQKLGKTPDGKPMIISSSDIDHKGNKGSQELKWGKYDSIQNQENVRMKPS